MCGRFENLISTEALVKSFRLYRQLQLINAIKDKFPKQYDVRPTNDIMIIKKSGDEYVIDTMRWGFKLKVNPAMMNSKVEEIIKGRAADYWQKLLDENPCLIVMNRFFEWKEEKQPAFTPTGRKTTKKVKQPYEFKFKDKDIFFCAGYYRRESDGTYSCTLITTSGNSVTRNIHPKDRMPVILDYQTGIDFLNGSIEDKIEFCLPYPDEMTLTQPCEIPTSEQ
ncbi:MAG TPA: SOS response-associated peptidase family protein [Ignavibacteria bacterium]|nr:SOS response-associated peptidase family protein [Ignavibacteria bacterium]